MSRKPEAISAAQARALILNAQGLGSRPAFARGKRGALAAAERLGYVQIDTIHVIERAHHHTLWSRVPGYDQRALDELQAQDRSVFEYWSHAASYLPMRDYRFSLPRMKAFAEGHRHWFRRNRKVMKLVLDRIRAEGPLALSDFDKPKGRGSGPWFEWTPAKRALEHLFHEGELMVARRRGFQKVFDLRERVLPAGVDTSMPSPPETGRHLVLRALGAQGLMSEREVAYLRSRDRKSVRVALLSLKDEGAIVETRVEGVEGERTFALPEALDGLSKRGAEERALHLLNPFDNLVIQRKRLKRYFGFDYLLECYVPEPKRKFGYFCLPILYGDRFVGRLDPKADRAGKALEVRSLHLEPGARLRGELKGALDEALERLARFNGCERVTMPERGT